MSGTLKPHTRVRAKIFAIVKINTNTSELSKSSGWAGKGGGGGGWGLAAHLRPQELYRLKNFYTYPKVEFKIL